MRHGEPQLGSHLRGQRPLMVAGLRVGDTCAVVCEPGLHPSGRLECLPGGRWSEATCFDAAEELLHQVVLRVNAEGINDLKDLVATHHLEALEVIGKVFERILASELKVAVNLFTSDITQDPQFSSTGYRLEVKVLCSETRKAKPLVVTEEFALPGFDVPGMRTFSDCDQKLQQLNQSIYTTKKTTYRSQLCMRICEVKENSCLPECLDSAVGLTLFPKTLLLQVLEEESLPGTRTNIIEDRLI
eukprot:symbB.v1.2.019828.t1/scaffold1629.1/size108820/6